MGCRSHQTRRRLTSVLKLTRPDEAPGNAFGSAACSVDKKRSAHCSPRASTGQEENFGSSPCGKGSSAKGPPRTSH